ncbi:Amino acid/polyamine transporter I [mine drainage metagenome]|uniref:Amino acid/polyamine transporter I n=1 Tax=mine drainage metagenome TaxID=410659 RepID=T1C3X2_9ZZZZ
MALLDPVEPPPEPGLSRRLGAFTGIMVVLGIVIGTGLYRVPALVASDVRSTSDFYLIWVIGGVIALCGALSVAELSAMFPRAGGLYVYIREAFGKPMAFLFGWMWLLTDPISWAAQSLIFSEYLVTFVPLDSLARHVASVVLIGIVAGVQIRSVGMGAFVQNFFGTIKLVTLFILGLALWFWIHPVAYPDVALHPVKVASGGFILALLAVLWAYDGWENLTALSGEVRKPERNLPLSLITGTLLVLLLYLVINGGYLRVLTLPGVASHPSVAVAALGSIGGSAASIVVALLVMISVLGSLNGSVMSDPRVFYAMAEDGLFFRRVGQAHARFRTPWVAIIMDAVLAMIFVSLRDFADLASAYVLGIWPFLMLAVAGLFWLRHERPDQPRPYRAWGYPVVPAVFLLASLLVLIGAAWQKPGDVILSLGLTLLGVPVYFVWQQAHRHNRRADPHA